MISADSIDLISVSINQIDLYLVGIDLDKSD